MRIVVALCLCLVVSLSPAMAAAQDAGAGDVDALEATLDELTPLLTGECAEACRALELMIRASERICQLDPGERCNRARQRVADATRRVRDACPECAVAAKLTEQEKTETDDKPAEPSPVTTPKADVETGGYSEGKGAPDPAAPPAEGERAGCAACTVGSPDTSGALSYLFGVIALSCLAFARRCARTRRP